MTAKRFERIYEDVDVFCRDHQAKGISQLLERNDYDTIVDLLNELHEENMMLKGEVAHYKLILLSLEEQAKRLSRIHCLGDKE